MTQILFSPVRGFLADAIDGFALVFVANGDQVPKKKSTELADAIKSLDSKN